MARGPESALKKLSKLREDRAALNAREAELAREAAAELGTYMMEAGADGIDPAKLTRIVKAVLKVGDDEALKRLEAAR